MLLPDYLSKKYNEFRPAILKRLNEFSKVKPDDYFYELCFCICTPQSKAKSAYEVEMILRDKDFYNIPFDPTDILRNPAHYIRFHNQKAARLLKIRKQFPEIKKLIESSLSVYDKRNELCKLVNGLGMKESSHFLRNIGFRGLGILDRHILKHLVLCGLYNEIPKISTISNYIEVEKRYIRFSEDVEIHIDELDLLFWSYEAGLILK